MTRLFIAAGLFIASLNGALAHEGYHTHMEHASLIRHFAQNHWPATLLLGGLAIALFTLLPRRKRNTD